MNKIMMEYWEDRLKKYVDVKIKGLPGRRRKEVSVEDPKAWRVVSVENSTEFNPNQFLNKKQVDTLCKGKKFEVTISAKKDRY